MEGRNESLEGNEVKIVLDHFGSPRYYSGVVIHADENEILLFENRVGKKMILNRKKCVDIKIIREGRSRENDRKKQK